MNLCITENISPVLPSKEQIQLLPKFKNLPKQHIFVLSTLEQCEALHQELEQVAVFGFDSESKPTFKVGEVQTGPHLIQLATLDHAYLFQMKPEIWQFLTPLLANRDQIKVGFGLKNDAHLFRKKGIELNSVIELSKCFAHFGLKNPVGVKNAIALLFQQNFPKNRKVSTSNWANKRLSQAQVDYAAADTYTCILIYKELIRLNVLAERMPNDTSSSTHTVAKNLQP